jgi:hypothetical protein
LWVKYSFESNVMPHSDCGFLSAGECQGSIGALPGQSHPEREPKRLLELNTGCS